MGRTMWSSSGGRSDDVWSLRREGGDELSLDIQVASCVHVPLQTTEEPNVAVASVVRPQVGTSCWH